jgi:NAD+ synthase
MTERFRITLAQYNPVVGDLRGNADQVRAAWAQAKSAGADLLALPEMFLTGYQVQDLVLRPAFLRDVAAELAALASDCADGPAIAIGVPLQQDGAVYNAYIVLRGGAQKAAVLKHHLPNDHVFDEERYFTAGPIHGPYGVGPVRIGSPICEDAWYADVAEAQAESGAQILLVPNGSPYARGKQELRQNLMVARVVETGLPLIYLNMVGGQDDQVFDGASFVLNPGGALAAQLPTHECALVHVDFEHSGGAWRALPGLVTPHADEWEQDYHTMVLALRDYLEKSGFSKVLLGLSGGIDSALVAAIAVDALGADHVRCVMLPSDYTSAHSLEDAAACARALGARLDNLPISGPRAAVENALAPLFAGTKADLAEENIQSRLRGLLLMALSNKFGEMLLTTGNKSEVAVGYATIYGDMAGGYNPIKDLYKMRVFETCRWRNANHRPWMKGPSGVVIPQRIIDKPPSAELRPDQKDEDSLPPYEVLDPILEGLVDFDLSLADLVAQGYDKDIVLRVQNLVFTSEYKRFQSAPGARLTRRAFWLDRRYPIVNRWRDRA